MRGEIWTQPKVFAILLICILNGLYLWEERENLKLPQSWKISRLLLGTTGDESSRSIAVDGVGNVYITGDTDGALSGTNAGDTDAWVAKYNSSGNQLFIKQLGTYSPIRFS